MQLRTTLRASFLAFLAGVLAFYFIEGLDSALWFALGGALALMNVFLAAWSIRMGMASIKKAGIFTGLLFFKSLSFLAVIAVVLVFLKPLLLPFTLGITIVIVGALLAALWELKFKK